MLQEALRYERTCLRQEVLELKEERELLIKLLCKYFLGTLEATEFFKELLSTNDFIREEVHKRTKQTKDLLVR